MRLHVLVACPGNSKLFVDLAASCCVSKKHHPELQVDILVPASIVPAWWNFSPPWFNLISTVSQAKTEYDLVIQAHPDPRLAAELQQISTAHRAGVILKDGIMVHGRWAQTLLAQFGTRRFGPFSPFDLFNHVLMGRTSSQPSVPRLPGAGKWIVDVDSLPSAWRSLAEDLLTQLSFAHPGQVKVDTPAAVDPSTVAAYIGADGALATWLAFHEVPVVLLHEGSFDPLNIVTNAQAWYQQLTPQLTAGQIIGLFRLDAVGFAGNSRYTDEFLGGLSSVAIQGAFNSPAEVFDLLHYVVLNYLNDLREVDLPIPEVSSSCCLHLKGTQGVFAKLIHLNQFGMKFLQEFLDKVIDGSVMEKDMQEIGQKVQEIDALTDKTLTTYPELDVYRLILKFAKASAVGDNMVEVAKSLILVLHESNQALQAYTELIEAIVKRHGRPVTFDDAKIP